MRILSIFLLILCMIGLSFAKVNLNSATLEELVNLKGIGKKKAKAIIEYRKKHPFKKVEDILNIKGIGKSFLQKNKENLCVGDDC